MKKVILGLAAIILLTWIMSPNESINERNKRWQEEIKYCEEERLYEIMDSMEIYRELVDDDIYQSCKNKILTF